MKRVISVLLLSLALSGLARAASYTNSKTVNIVITASDAGLGLANMRISTDGNVGNTQIFTSRINNYDFTAANPAEGKHTICVEVQDAAGNWSLPFCADVWYDTSKPVIQQIQIITTIVGQGK